MYKRKLFCSFDQRQTYLAVLNWNFQQESSKNRPIAGSHSQWRIKGRGPPLFLDQTEARRAEKICFETVAPPPPNPPLIFLSEALDPPLVHVVRARHAGEQEKHWEQTNKGTDLFIVNHDVSSLFFLSRCVCCSPPWRFCTTWMTNCKGPISEERIAEVEGTIFNSTILSACMLALLLTNTVFI